jgi:putative transposase
MATRKHPFIPGECYHIYNRGNGKRKIFLDDNDYFHFVKCLFVCNTYKNFKFRDDIVDAKIDTFEFDRGELLVSIGAWVLMPNHFHIYLTINSNNPHISDMWGKNQVTEFIRKLSTSYSKYFNAKYNHSGGLFEGPFKSVLVSDDIQAKYLFSYIHLNPIKLIDKNWKENGVKNTKAVLDFLTKYKWSSYLDYRGIIRRENSILNPADFPNYFNEISDFDEEIFNWINNFAT